MKGKLLTALYLASCVASVNVYATDTNPSWYVLPQVGVMAPDETTMGIFAALKMGKQMTDNIDVQIGVSRGVAKDEAAGYLNSKYSQDALTVEGLYFLSRDTWRPFVQAGIVMVVINLQLRACLYLHSKQVSHHCIKIAMKVARLYWGVLA